MDVLDALPETVDRLTRSRDPRAIDRVVAETEAALDLLHEHKAATAQKLSEPALSANGHKRRR
jgi:hypothetical protein